MKTKSRRSRKRSRAGEQKPPTELTEVTGTEPIARMLRDATVRGHHELIGRSLLAGVVAVFPRVFSALAAARRAYRKPTRNATKRARRLAKTWGV